MNTNWDNLRYFNALAQFSTLSEAARRMGVSHSTVQRHIASFESDLNAKLFQASANGYQLTSVGLSLYRETKSIQQSLNAITSRIASADKTMSGSVSITVTDTIGHFILPQVLIQLREHYPEITFDISIVNTLSNIQEFEADIAVRTGNEPPAALIGRQVGKVAFAACAAKQYLSSHSLNTANGLQQAKHFIGLDNNFASANFIEWQSTVAGNKKTIHVNGFLGAYQLCQAGLGVTLLPAYLLQYNTDLVSLKCSNLPNPNTLWVLSHPDLRDSPRVKAVRRHLAEQLALAFKDS